jgi:ParB/RepB/Spo0J family partition protein
MAEEKLYEVKVANIEDDAKTGLNVRRTDRDIGVEELAKSIHNHGLLQPIVLRGKPERPPYKLIAGHRRLAAHKLLDRPLIKARFKPPTYGDFQAKVDSLVENLQRVKLNHADTAEAITAMYTEFGKSVSKVAKELGISEVTVREYLVLDRVASPKAKRLLREGRVTKQDVKRVIRAAQGSMHKADRLLDYLPDMTRYDKERMAKYGEDHPEAKEQDIVDEAKKPRYECTLILSLTPQVDKALDTACQKMDMDRNAIAEEAISDWLRENGFLAA